MDHLDADGDIRISHPDFRLRIGLAKACTDQSIHIHGMNREVGVAPACRNLESGRVPGLAHGFYRTCCHLVDISCAFKSARDARNTGNAGDELRTVEGLSLPRSFFEEHDQAPRYAMDRYKRICRKKKFEISPQALLETRTIFSFESYFMIMHKGYTLKC